MLKSFPRVFGMQIRINRCCVSILIVGFREHAVRTYWRLCFARDSRKSIERIDRRHRAGSGSRELSAIAGSSVCVWD